MDIQLNGEPRHLRAPLSLAGLLNDEGLAGRRVAIEVNGEIVPRSLHDTHQLQDGDVVEIVHALGGG
ncbi:sulfur carrier protein ThiS [Stenotrophomonas sp. JC08]|uniref:sulfur carrier protein ThiS n=1 Tax=Stenotrophomonas sp. JC08 TaxID=3445779 RepID=UPI003FA1F984